jgi:hypothetical protein
VVCSLGAAIASCGIGVSLPVVLPERSPTPIITGRTTIRGAKLASSDRAWLLQRHAGWGSSLSIAGWRFKRGADGRGVLSRRPPRDSEPFDHPDIAILDGGLNGKVATVR